MGDAFALTVRDAEILGDVALSNAMGIGQVARLHFTGVSRARRRMAALESAGLVRRSRFTDGIGPASSVFAIAPKAVGLVAETVGMDVAEAARRARRPVERSFLEHALGVNDLRIALACGGLDAEFMTEYEVRHEYALAAGAFVFKPDGMIRVNVPSGVTCAFLEFDRAHASLPKLAASFRGYARYVRAGLFEGEYGASTPVVLFATTGGARRVAHVARVARAAKEAGCPAVWLARFSDAVASGAEGRCWTAGPGGEAASFADIVGRAGS